MERLTERELYNGEVCYTKCAKTNCKDSCYDCPVEQEADVRLKKYEDAEEQGLLKIFPCRVGDTVFLVQYGKMYERKVNGFSVTSNNQLVIHIPDFEMDNASFPEHTFGKFVFFDREEAESALAEKGGVE